MSELSFFWHDYETFGADPSRDRPSQFAGIRTDTDFNIIGDPLVLYCKPAADMLPHPQACLITGITPQIAAQQGVIEADFIARIHDQLAAPGTCGVGYNSIRFDDEVTRYTLYRNFFDPYAREWQNGNSRWDIIDMVRVCRALRPEGITWPDHADGVPSFKLEDLTTANGICHAAAHDALSDVHATIAMAKLVKQAQPRLFDYLFQLRNKHRVAELLDVNSKLPVLHTSAMFAAARLCTSLVMPLVKHPVNSNGVVCFDLACDPSALIELPAEAIRERLYTPAQDLPDGEQRIALKTIHINRCPVVATSKLLDSKAADRLQLDPDRLEQHRQQLLQARGLEAKLRAVFESQDFPDITDPDRMLYSGAFFGNADKQTMARIRNCSPRQLAEQTFVFEDQRLPEMLFRYRARNFPDTLNADDTLLWEEYRYQRLTEPDAGGSISLDDYQAMIDAALADPDCSERDRQILQALLAYGDMLLA